MRIRMFGELAVEHGGRVLGSRDLGGVKPRQLFEMLLAARGHPVPKQRLASLLWGDKLPQNVRASLEQYVCVVRRSLAGGDGRAEQLVVTQSRAYRFRVEEADVDLDRFDELVERAALQVGQARRRTLEQALALARGDVLEDEPNAPWAAALRETYRQRVEDLRIDAAAAALAARDLRGALGHAQAGSMADPLDERPYRIAMLAHYALGRQHHALETFRRLCAALESELGVEPMPETKALQLAVQRQVDPESLLPPRDDAGERALPVLTVVERQGRASVRHQVEPLARTLGAELGAARCAPGRRNAAEVLGAALVDAVGRKAVREELRTPRAVVEAIRRHAPLVLVLEDLHHAEPESFDVLEELQRDCADVPVVVVATYRRGLVPAGHPLAAADAAAEDGSVLRSNEAKTWLLRIMAPLTAAVRAALEVPMWIEDLIPGVEEILPALPGLLV